MSHPDEGKLQALLDDELRGEHRLALEAHLDGCAACSAELASLRGAGAEVGAALRLLDAAPDVGRARWRFEKRRRASRSGAVLRRTAYLVLGSAAVLSATVPGSPLRGWLAGGGAETEVRDAGSARAVEAPAALAAGAETASAGVSVAPADGRMRVVLTDAAPGVLVRIQVHGGERVGVWADGAAASARFHTAPDRVEMRGGGEGEVRVEVPRAIRSFTLEVNGRMVVQRDGDRFRLADPTTDSAGAELRFEVRP